MARAREKEEREKRKRKREKEKERKREKERERETERALSNDNSARVLSHCSGFVLFQKAICLPGWLHEKREFVFVSEKWTEKMKTNPFFSIWFFILKSFKKSKEDVEHWDERI